MIRTIEPDSGMKCLSCIHSNLCFNIFGGMGLQMKAEDCKEYTEINKDVWVAPCRRDDIVYIVDGLKIYSANVLCIEASLLPNNDISWTLKVSFKDEFETLQYTSGIWEHQIFRTKDEAEIELLRRKVLYANTLGLRMKEDYEQKGDKGENICEYTMN